MVAFERRAVGEAFKCLGATTLLMLGSWVRAPSGSPRKKESYIKITLFFYIRIKLVKPRMDFPDQFSKIFLAYQPFPSAPTRKFEAFMPSCPHCKHNKLTINHLYANGKNTCSHSYPHALTTFSRKISHSILFINHILSFL